MRDLGVLSWFWGIQFKCKDDCIEMNQNQYIPSRKPPSIRRYAAANQRLVLQFHGDSDKSITLCKAAKGNNLTKIKVWNELLCKVADALEHIHNCGFIHNDLKSNNVLLETREGHPTPVIMDFGKNPRPNHLTSVDCIGTVTLHWNLSTGTSKPSVTVLESRPSVCVLKEIFALKITCSRIPAKRFLRGGV